MEAIAGKWKSATTEGSDEYMKAMGVGLVLRKVGGSATLYLEYSQLDEDTWSLKYKLAFKSGEIKFKLGEEFDEVTPDGRNVKTTISCENACVTHKLVGQPHSTCTTRRLLENGDLEEITTIEGMSDIQLRRTFKRQ